MRTILVPVLVAMSMTTAAPALAEAEKVEIHINYGDLDLEKPGDVAILLDRIDKKVEEACTQRTYHLGMSKTVDHACIAGATSAAVAELEKRKAERLAMR